MSFYCHVSSKWNWWVARDLYLYDHFSIEQNKKLHCVFSPFQFRLPEFSIRAYEEVCKQKKMQTYIFWSADRLKEIILLPYLIHGILAYVSSDLYLWDHFNTEQNTKLCSIFSLSCLTWWQLIIEQNTKLQCSLAPFQFRLLELSICAYEEVYKLKNADLYILKCSKT